MWEKCHDVVFSMSGRSHSSMPKQHLTVRAESIHTLAFEKKKLFVFYKRCAFKIDSWTTFVALFMLFFSPHCLLVTNVHLSVCLCKVVVTKCLCKSFCATYDYYFPDLFMTPKQFACKKLLKWFRLVYYPFFVGNIKPNPFDFQVKQIYAQHIW